MRACLHTHLCMFVDMFAYMDMCACVCSVYGRRVMMAWRAMPNVGDEGRMCVCVWRGKGEVEGRGQMHAGHACRYACSRGYTHLLRVAGVGQLRNLLLDLAQLRANALRAAPVRAHALRDGWGYE